MKAKKSFVGTRRSLYLEERERYSTQRRVDISLKEKYNTGNRYKSLELGLIKAKIN